MWNVVASLVSCQAGQEESLGQEERTGLGPASQIPAQLCQAQRNLEEKVTVTLGLLLCQVGKIASA